MHILIIRPGTIGDTLLTFPIIQALKAQYTNPHVTFIGNRAVLPLALAYGIVDEAFDLFSGKKNLHTGLVNWLPVHSTIRCLI
jgi:ADP-heptose:LPS heptosyltransferase